jgi:hypothetical protein
VVARNASVAIAGEVFGGETDLDERLFDVAAGGGSDREFQRRPALAQPGHHVFAAGNLFGERLLVGLEHQAALIAQQFHAAIARGVIADLEEHVLRDRVLGKADEGLDDFVGRDTGRAGIPDGERGDAVGVNVLGSFHELREAGQAIAGGGVMRAGDFGEDGVIALHDQRVLWLIDRDGHRARAGEYLVG